MKKQRPEKPWELFSRCSNKPLSETSWTAKAPHVAGPTNLRICSLAEQIKPVRNRAMNNVMTAMSDMNALGAPVKTDDDRPQSADFVALNKNFMNYPLARDAKVKADWRRSEKGWSCPLPGDERITMCFSGQVGQRLPTGLDMNVLARLLAEAAKRDSAVVEMLSGNAFVKVLGLSATTRNRRRLKLSLQLWVRLSIDFECWHSPSPSKFGKGKREPKSFPPPIASIDGNKITINNTWLETMKKGFFEQMPLPLPMNAAAQNLVLLMLNGLEKTLSPKRQRCKLGIDHKEHKRALANARSIAVEWLLDQDSSLIGAPNGHFVIVKRPRVPKSKKQGEVMMNNRTTPEMERQAEFVIKVFKMRENDIPHGWRINSVDCEHIFSKHSYEDAVKLTMSRERLMRSA